MGWRSGASLPGETSRLQIDDAPCHTENVATQTIVILDFGSQYTQLIARRIREQNVFSVVLPCTAPLAEIKALKPLGIVLSGGPSSVYDADAPAADPKLLELGVPVLHPRTRPVAGTPVLGICYGLHFIVHHLGGKVRSGAKREYGHAEVTHRGQRDAAVCRPAAHARRLDEPRRRGAGAARGLSSHRHLRQCAGGNRRCRAPHLGGAVSSRGASHAAGSADHPELCLQHLRRARRLDARRTSSRPPWPRFARRSARGTSSAASPAASTRRWRRCWCTGPSAASSPASSSTTACCAKTNSQSVQKNHARPAGPERRRGGCERAVSRETGRGHRSRNQAQANRRRVHRRLRRRGHAHCQRNRRRGLAGAGHALSRRDRVVAASRAPARPSRAITTWAGCRWG